MNDVATTLAELKVRIQAFIDERDWRQFHDPKNLAMSIAIETAELMEHFQWVRSEDLHAIRRDPEKMQEIREELADLTIFAVSFANAMEIDVAEAIERKLLKNARKYPVERYKGRYE